MSHPLLRALALALALALPLPLAACSGEGMAPAAQDSPAESSEAPPAPASGDALAALRQKVADTTARPEHDAEVVKVAHILIAFEGAERSTATRSKEEAELRAAELLVRVEAGEDFVTLMRESSDDSGPGIYTMTTGAPSRDVYPRAGMALAFGDTGWRLEVGQVGVAAYDPAKSQFGWHIIKRVE